MKHFIGIVALFFLMLILYSFIGKVTDKEQRLTIDYYAFDLQGKRLVDSKKHTEIEVQVWLEKNASSGTQYVILPVYGY